MKILKYFLIIFFAISMVRSQKMVSIPESEVITWAQNLQRLEKADSSNQIIISDLELIVQKLEENSYKDSIIIDKTSLQIQLLKDTNELLEKKVKLVKPKWYENKWIWFVYGVGSTAISVNLAGQLVN
jgi:hypothetical protein|tara:strand:+ start:4313 stop:4696 length:384 start_codon:yes stop_codon:yes gene_type:complete